MKKQSYLVKIREYREGSRIIKVYTYINKSQPGRRIREGKLK